MNFSAGTLVASLIWGSVGMGFLIYGKKQTSAPALFGGMALVAISYFVASPIWMSLAAVAIIVGIYGLAKHG